MKGIIIRRRLLVVSVCVLAVLASFTPRPAKATLISLNISGVSQSFSASLVNFNLTLFQFGGARTGMNDSVISISTSGTEEVFKLIVSGGAVNSDIMGISLKGIFGKEKFIGGQAILDTPWWDFDFTLNLFDREASEGSLSRLDEVSVTNGRIKHLVAPHKNVDKETGVDLVWGDLNLIANATKVEANGIRKNALSPPLDCEDHPPKGKIVHRDCITEGTLSGKVTNGILGDDFESWRLVAKAQHVAEPNTIFLLLVGSVLLMLKRKFPLRTVNYR